VWWWYQSRKSERPTRTSSPQYSNVFPSPRFLLSLNISHPAVLSYRWFGMSFKVTLLRAGLLAGRAVLVLGWWYHPMKVGDTTLWRLGMPPYDITSLGGDSAFLEPPPHKNCQLQDFPLFSAPLSLSTSHARQFSHLDNPECRSKYDFYVQFSRRVERYSHMQILIIYKLGFNQNYYTFAWILLIKIVLCSKFHWTKLINYKCFHMNSSSANRPGIAVVASNNLTWNESLNYQDVSSKWMCGAVLMVFFFFITLKPRVEWCTSLWALTTSPPWNRSSHGGSRGTHHQPTWPAPVAPPANTSSAATWSLS